MQSISQTTEIVSYVTGTPRGRANQITRALIDAGVLPKSSGRAVKKIAGDGLLCVLAAVAMADKVNEAARVASEIVALPMVGEDNCTLADFFCTIMMPDSPWHNPQLEMAKTANGYTAKVTGQFVNDDGEIKEFTLPFWRKKSWGHFCKTSFTISGQGMTVMRNLFQRDDIEGMVFKLSDGDAE